MAVHARLKKEFTEDEKYHNLISWLILFVYCVFLLLAVFLPVLHVVHLIHWSMQEYSKVFRFTWFTWLFLRTWSSLKKLSQVRPWIVTIMIHVLSFEVWADSVHSGQTTSEGTVWSRSTLFVIPSACFGHLIQRKKNRLFKFQDNYSNFLGVKFFRIFMVYFSGLEIS